MSNLALSTPELGWDLSAIGLRLKNPEMPFEEFENLCWVLGRWHEIVRFAIGDAIIQGEALYGEAAYQAFEALHLSEDGMREYVRVADRVPRARRRKDLSWSHHRAVAALEAPEQKEWLKRAADEGMSHHALRDALRNGAEPHHPEVCRCCGKRL